MISQTCFMELDVSDRVQVMNKYSLMANYSIIYQDYPHICLHTQGVRSNRDRLHRHQELSLHPVLWSPSQVRFNNLWLLVLQVKPRFAWIGTNQFLSIGDHKITDPVSQVGAWHNQGRQTGSAWGWGTQYCRRLRQLSTSRPSWKNTIWSLSSQVPWGVSLQREGSLPQGVSLRQGILPEVAISISEVTANVEEQVIFKESPTSRIQCWEKRRRRRRRWKAERSLQGGRRPRCRGEARKEEVRPREADQGRDYKTSCSRGRGGESKENELLKRRRHKTAGSNSQKRKHRGSSRQNGA